MAFSITTQVGGFGARPLEFIVGAAGSSHEARSSAGGVFHHHQADVAEAEAEIDRRESKCPDRCAYRSEPETRGRTPRPPATRSAGAVPFPDEVGLHGVRNTSWSNCQHRQGDQRRPPAGRTGRPQIAGGPEAPDDAGQRGKVAQGNAPFPASYRGLRFEFHFLPAPPRRNDYRRSIRHACMMHASGIPFGEPVNASNCAILREAIIRVIRAALRPPGRSRAFRPGALHAAAGFEFFMNVSQINPLRAFLGHQHGDPRYRCR